MDPQREKTAGDVRGSHIEKAYKIEDQALHGLSATSQVKLGVDGDRRLMKQGRKGLVDNCRRVHVWPPSILTLWAQGDTNWSLLGVPDLREIHNSSGFPYPEISNCWFY
ncbi:hypothetical protein O3P69_001385 [Scylla paramamosain]|uniref:Uncharacterized protein n=1 Tax=Scylla paramamosain TaxID=85552 RepID=A0AAW0UR49_SCYPA